MVFWLYIDTRFFSANGNLCWWWDQVDPSRSCTGIFNVFFFFGNIFVSSVDCLLLIQLMHIFIVSLCSTTFYWRRPRKTANWMIFLTHWTSIRLSFLSRVWPELLSWTSYLPSVTSPLSVSIQEWHRRRGLSSVAWIHFIMESTNALAISALNF